MMEYLPSLFQLCRTHDALQYVLETPRLGLILLSGIPVLIELTPEDLNCLNMFLHMQVVWEEKRILHLYFPNSWRNCGCCLRMCTFNFLYFFFLFCCIFSPKNNFEMYNFSPTIWIVWEHSITVSAGVSPMKPVDLYCCLSSSMKNSWDYVRQIKCHLEVSQERTGTSVIEYLSSAISSLY